MYDSNTRCVYFSKLQQIYIAARTRSVTEWVSNRSRAPYARTRRIRIHRERKREYRHSQIAAARTGSCGSSICTETGLHLIPASRSNDAFQCALPLSDSFSAFVFPPLLVTALRRYRVDHASESPRAHLIRSFVSCTAMFVLNWDKISLADC